MNEKGSTYSRSGAFTVFGYYLGNEGQASRLVFIFYPIGMGWVTRAHSTADGHTHSIARTVEILDGAGLS